MDLTYDEHARAMDRMYRYQRYIYDATRRYYLPGRDRLIHHLHPPAGGTVLEIGCGTGRNLIRAALRYPSARFCGCDISTEMLKSAGAAIEKASLADRVRVAWGDATSFNANATFGCSKFDRIFFSYAVSMIPAWDDAIAHALELLTPQGQLHLIDFGQCERWPAFARRSLVEWLKLFGVKPRAEFEHELRGQAAIRNVPLSYTTLYRGYAAYIVLGV